MLNLLKADLRKYSQTKLIYIVLLVNSFMFLMSVFILFQIGLVPIFEMETTGRSLIYGSFNPTNDAGLIINILVAVLITQEFSHGTIRNKIISGYKRWQIYLSLTLATLIVSLSLYLINILLTACLGPLFLGYGQPFNTSEFFELVEAISLSVLIYTFFVLIGILVAMIIRRTSIAIITHLLVLMGSGLTVILYSFPNNKDILDNVLTFLPIVQNLKLITDGVSRKLTIYILLTQPLYYLFITGFGIWLFKIRNNK